MEGIAFAIIVAASGGVMAVASHSGLRRATFDIQSYLEDTSGHEPADMFAEKLKRPFTSRVFGGAGRGVLRSVERFTPRSYLAGIRHKLQMAGLADQRSAAEHLASQVAVGGLLAGAGFLYVLAVGPGLPVVLTAVVLLPAVGFMYPSARLSRQVDQRSTRILEDLPDTLDLLAISVEAGVGFEGAMGVVCDNFDSPLADEFALVLTEMQLGLSRREAFQNLKRRTDIEPLSNFILAMIQADVLGIPVGRVLKTQAVEMRSQRRQWAREKAAKLPVKILVPLVFFIFPPVLIIVIGPAALSFGSISG